MQCIGNDIIALKTIDVARTITPSFYNKILANSEQELYHAKFSHIPFHHFVWMLWSIKESAYKCLQRQQNDLVFSPANIVIEKLDSKIVKSKVSAKAAKLAGPDLSQQFTGTVVFQSQTLYAKSHLSGEDLIHTIVVNFQHWEGSINAGAKPIDHIDPESQSAAARELLMFQLNHFFPGKHIVIEKHSSGYPFVIIDGVNIPISLSHHHNWVGYAVFI